MEKVLSFVRKLRQEVQALWSDEVVFNIIVDIFHREPEKFLDLFPHMVPFHCCRVGIDDAMVECEIVGSVVVASPLDGSHYARAIAGISVVEDVSIRMVCRAFWPFKEVRDYVFQEVHVILDDVINCSIKPLPSLTSFGMILKNSSKKIRKVLSYAST